MPRLAPVTIATGAPLPSFVRDLVMTVDVRTRVDGTVQPVEASSFFEEALPAALAHNADLLAQAITHISPSPLTVVVDGSRWTMRPLGDRITVEPGAADDAQELTLTDVQLSDIAHDQVTPMGWFTSGQLALKGRLSNLLDWWLLVRGALDGIAPHVPGALSFNDDGGDALDLSRTFAVDEGADDMRQFLEQAGFLHIGGVFTEDEMAAISSDMDALAPSYSKGDGRSWWARTDAGDDRLVRMQYFDQVSERGASLMQDERLLRIGRLTGDGHEPNWDAGNLVEALIKPLGIVEGISDVPWHKDCSLGRHSYECCSLTIGISVTGAGPKSGQLRVVAGSHRALVWPALDQPGLDLPALELPTETGDVTLHLSCTLHMAQPPVERERRVLYTGFRLPASDPDAASAARQRLREVREAAPLTVSQPAAPSEPEDLHGD
jgi:hypothetical protein